MESSSESSAVPLRIGVVTLFPELFDSFIKTSFVGRAMRSGLVDVHMMPLRPFGLGQHQSVDDTPYGGGSGMVMRVDCIVRAIHEAEITLGGRARRILMTPQGERLSGTMARERASEERLLLICGRYEGFDERIRAYVDDEVSLGDFVLTGGEIAAMALIESTIRFRPGVLGNEESVTEESFSPELGGGLEYPQYTRPAEYEGRGVPEVLRSGDHGKIKAWRREQSQTRTLERRPDLCARSITGGEPSK
jgi:tRNA (guanine37-N1)-methyltransferase